MKKVELHNVDAKNFVKQLELCKGEVYLTTEEGDRLNLKSALCRVIGLTSLIEGGQIAKANIECELQEDETKLFRFNLYGKTEK